MRRSRRECSPHGPRSAAPNGSCARGTIRRSPPSARGPSRYRRRSCLRPSAGSAQSNRRRYRSIAARSRRAARRPRPRRPPPCRRPASPRSRSARPPDATLPPSRSGHGPWSGRRNGNSSSRMLSFQRFSDISGHPAGDDRVGLQTVLWHIHPLLGNGWHAKGRRWQYARICRALRGFPCPACLINGRHAAQGRRPLPIRRAAGLPGAARAAARACGRPRAERQRAAGA